MTGESAVGCNVPLYSNHYNVESELAQCAPRVEPILSDMVQLLSEEEEEKESMVSGCCGLY